MDNLIEILTITSTLSSFLFYLCVVVLYDDECYIGSKYWIRKEFKGKNVIYSKSPMTDISILCGKKRTHPTLYKQAVYVQVTL